MEAVFLLGVGYTRDTATAITCLTIAVGFSGFAISGSFFVFFSSIEAYYSTLIYLTTKCETVIS